MAVIITDLGDPVVGARNWASAIVPRVGGWKWMIQLYNHPNTNPTEWVIMDVETGDYTITEDSLWQPNDRGRYIASSNFHNIDDGLRAANERVFWPAISCYWWWYNPTTENIVEMDRVSGTSPDASTYTMVFNHDGSKMYGGTQTANNSPNKMPSVFEIDPNTTPPSARFLCRVGSLGRTQAANYAYNVWADGGWLYVLVGQEFWDVVAVNIATGVQTVLETAGAGSWAYFHEIAGEGLTVRLVSNLGKPSETTHWFWVNDGAIAGDYSVGVPPPFAAHDVDKYSNPPFEPPQIDDSASPVAMAWRDFGSSGPWTVNTYEITHAEPINLDSLFTLPSGNVFGSSLQYNGFFTFDPDTSATTYHAPWDQIAEPVYCPTDRSGKIYFSGYPNGALYEYDETQPWLVTGPAASQNPLKLGNYSNGVTLSGVKRSKVLVYSADLDRLYMVGDRDRSGDGAGIGYYKFSNDTFAGTFAGLSTYDSPLGLAVFDSIDRVALGGRVLTGEAQIVIYDRDLTEIERVTPFVGGTDSGRLFGIPSEPTVMMGLTDAGLAYRFDMVSKTVTSQADYTSLGNVGPTTQESDGDVVAMLGDTMYRINPVTLAITEVTFIDGLVSLSSIIGTDVYFTVGPTLFVADTTTTAADRIDPDLLVQQANAGVAKLPEGAIDVIIAAINQHAGLIGGTTIDTAIISQRARIGRAATVQSAVSSIIATLNAHAALIGGATIDTRIMLQTAPTGRAIDVVAALEIVIDTVNSHADVIDA